MKKIIILLAAIAITGIASADITLTKDFGAPANFTVKAKAIVDASTLTATSCLTQAFTITMYVDVNATAPTLDITGPNATVNGVAVYSELVDAIDVAATSLTNPNTDAIDGHGVVCPGVYKKYVWTFTGGEATAAGTYTFTLTDNSTCGDASAVYTYDVVAPFMPDIAVTILPACENDNAVVTLSNVDGAFTGDITVNYTSTSTCGTNVGLPGTLTFPANASNTSYTQTVEAGAAGTFTFTVTSITYSLTGCGTVTINNSHP